MSEMPAAFELWFKRAKDRLDILSDECRENAALCNVDSAEGQQWVKLAVELESISEDVGIPAMYELRQLFDGKKIYVMDKTHVENTHKPLTEISFWMEIDGKTIFTGKEPDNPDVK